MTEQQGIRWQFVAGRIVLFCAILALGVVLMKFFASLKEPAKTAEVVEPAIEVEIAIAEPENVPVTVQGFGNVRSRDTVAIAAKVPGDVIEVHPHLEAGGLVRQDEVLFRIDPADYEARLTQAEAQVGQLENSLALLREKAQQDRSRLDVIKRTRDLAKGEYDRDKGLYENDRVGSQSQVDFSERNYLQAKDAYEQAEQGVGLYPLRIAEAEQGLEAARAQRDLARLALERTTVTAPFDGRVKMAQLEVGQTAAPGMPVVSLSDDSALEISVPLDSRDAQGWLQFEEVTPEEGWFAKPVPVTCTLRWTEDTSGAVWEGELTRVERFDPTTRTLTVAITVEGAKAHAKETGLPLVEGMFCEVSIPGKTMQQVVRLPRWAVSFEGEAFFAEDDAEGRPRLQKRQVDVLRAQGEEVYVSSGIDPGDRVIVTRLANPMRNHLLEIIGETPTPELNATTTPPAGAPS
ncbi:MAG: HlyD family efflux transporter periplasmic adaptor subunit [Candidatus Hydrogenedens sp.]|nr:HlyD family efflux transporter periplasmic adaptor subunit [Candidatus Hydrogenedens sp.]